MPDNHNIALRVQSMALKFQTLLLAQIVSARDPRNILAPAEVTRLFDEFALPAPAKISNTISALMKEGLLTKGPTRSTYRVTPRGRKQILDEFSDGDLAALSAESAVTAAPELGSTLIPLVPPSLAPPALVLPLRTFLNSHPFDRNVFGMTRYPSASPSSTDPLGKALEAARNACQLAGLEFHLASDRAISDDLWTNVTAHMWGSRYGIAFLEDRAERGLNHNLLVEVGGMLTTGRRCALLKDGTIDKLPTDFVGMIYKPVDFSDTSSVESALSKWIKDDLLI